jgi:hypothetical protein
MTVQYDVKSAYLEASGVLVDSRCRLKQLIFLPNGTAGSVVIYDNASAGSGNVVWRTKVGTGVQPFQLIVPGEGILAYNGLYVTLTNITSITVCYG